MTQKSVEENAGDRQAFEWEEKWLQERHEHPSCLIVRFDEPLEAGNRVFVGCHAYQYVGLKPGDKDFLKWSPLLIDETLTSSTCLRLGVVLNILEECQGINAHEAMAYLTQLYLIRVDVRRVGHGDTSLLFTNRSDQVEDYLKRREVMKRGDGDLQSLHPTPALWSIDHLLDAWNIYGGKYALGFPPPEGEVEGKWSYRIIPPGWLHPEVAKHVNEVFARRGERVQPIKVPILVEPTKKALVELLAGVCQEGAKQGLSIQLNLGTTSTEPKREKSHPELVIALDGRSVNFKGECFSFTSTQALVLHFAQIWR